MALGAFALERFVQGRTEHFPQFLLGLAVQRHGLGFGLPALLQGFDGVHTQNRRRTHLPGFFDQGLASLDAGFLGCFQAGRCVLEDRLPLRLHFAKRLLVEVTGIAPAVGKLVQGPQLGAPVIAIGMGCGPRFDFFHQDHALGTVLGRFFFHLLQPGHHRLVGLVASGVKTPPKGRVGQAALVGLLPAFAQHSQFVLQLAPAQGGHFFSVQQGLGLGDQTLAHLVGQPALPAFAVARIGQGFVNALVQCGVKIFAVHLEGFAQRRDGLQSQSACGRLGLHNLLLQSFEHPGHGLQGLLAQKLALRRVHFGFGGLVLTDGVFDGLFGRRHRTRGCGWGRAGGQDLPTQTSDFIGPHRHRRHGRRRIGQGLLRQGQGGRKPFPYRQQLALRSVELGGVLHLHTGPNRVGLELLGLALPLGHVRLQTRLAGLGFGNRFGGQDLNALGQQDGGFTLHHHLVLHIFHALDHFGQTLLPTGQGLARQRGTGFGGVALPGHGVAHVQARSLQKLLSLQRPVGDQGFLAFGAFEFIELFFEHFGRAFVAPRHFLKHLAQHLGLGVRQQPLAQAGAAFAGCGGGESAPGQLVEGGQVKRLGR